MNSRVVAWCTKVLLWINACYEESIFGKAFNRIWQALGKAFSGSFIHRFFSNDKKRENVWDNSIFGKIVNLPRKFILFLQRKLSRRIKRQLEKSVICNAFSKWNLVSVRVYGVLIIAFCVATTFLRENSKMTLAILLFGEILGLLLVLINRSLKQLTSGSSILKSISNIFIEPNDSDISTVKIKTYYYVIACAIGIILSLICVATSITTLVLIVGAVLSFAFLMRYLTLGVFLTVALSPILPTMVLVGLSFICAFVFLIHAIANKNFKFSRTPFNVAVVFFVISLLWGIINSFAMTSSIKQVMVHGSFILFYFVLINGEVMKKFLIMQFC